MGERDTMREGENARERKKEKREIGIECVKSTDSR